MELSIFGESDGVLIRGRINGNFFSETIDLDTARCIIDAIKDGVDRSLELNPLVTCPYCNKKFHKDKTVNKQSFKEHSCLQTN